MRYDVSTQQKKDSQVLDPNGQPFARFPVNSVTYQMLHFCYISNESFLLSYSHYYCKNIPQYCTHLHLAKNDAQVFTPTELMFDSKICFS